LPLWQGLAGQASARHAVEALLHLPMTREQWQQALTARFGAAATDAVDALTSRGLFEWRGAGRGRVELVESGAPSAAPRPVSGYGTEEVLDLLRRQGALFAADLARRLALSLSDVEHALALLEDAGLAANDLLSRTGRWSAVQNPLPLGEDRVREAEYLTSYAEALLRRYGIVSREVLRAERSPIRWAHLERLLRLWEWRGRAIRGDFVRELSGPQFARREAVDLLREAAPSREPLLVPWDDPANAWGHILPLPAPRGKGRFLMLLDGLPLLAISGWGRTLEPGPAWNPEHVAAVATALRGLAAYAPNGCAALERWHGGSILVSPLAAPLREAGFARAGIRLLYRHPRSLAQAV
ncbi:MAG TPA: hypothetical protein VF157_01560, partial [Chloroflexota bacterium]